MKRISNLLHFDAEKLFLFIFLSSWVLAVAVQCEHHIRLSNFDLDPHV